MFFGLSLRQFMFALLAVGSAVGAYFIFNPTLGLETTSWICIMCAVPFEALGFIRYNGMSADQLLGNPVSEGTGLPEQQPLHGHD